MSLRTLHAGSRPADGVQVGHVEAELAGEGGVAAVVVAALAAGVADLASMREAVGGLVQQGAEHVDRAEVLVTGEGLQRGPVGGLVGELPAASAKAPRFSRRLRGFLPEATHADDRGDVGVVNADGGPSVFQDSDQTTSSGAINQMRRPWRGLLA